MVAAYSCSVGKCVCFGDLTFLTFLIIDQFLGLFVCFNLFFKGDSNLSVSFSLIRNKNINKTF